METPIVASPAINSVPVVVCDRRAECGLDSRTRAFMESRFRAEFGHVRIHTDREAAAAAVALGADAFTLGPDIFFAAGRYAPETPRGQRLLAHELTHVLQQVAERPREGIYRVGAPGDAEERLARQVSREVLTCTRATHIPRDNHQQVVRRAITLDPGTARITLDFQGAQPTTFIDSEASPSGQIPFVTAHLKRNFAPGKIANIAAWTATGRVAVSLGPFDAAEIPQWNFGFIQFMEITALNAFYAGRAPSDGGILVQAHTPPALVRSFGRDAPGTVDINSPWTTLDTTGDKTLSRGGFAQKRTEDHPQLRLRMVMENRSTAYKNFMFRFMDIRKFVIVFSARNPGGSFQHLAHFELLLTYDFDVVWKRLLGDLTPLTRPRAEASFAPGPVRLGPPKDRRVQPFLTDPTSAQRLGTTELSGAIRSVYTGGAPNRLDEKSRLGVVPGDFFP